MAKKNQIFRCEECGIMLVALKDSECDPSCGDHPMKLLAENTVDASKEKHTPVVTKVAGGYKVAVGSVPHPMDPDHFIEWIELLADGFSYRKFLKPGDKPEALFLVEATLVSAREYCNKHGLWSAKA
jgi:superoxide reductase